jgi:energy-coupling factor transporter ATP-binding protein EcfA2
MIHPPSLPRHPPTSSENFSSAKKEVESRIAKLMQHIVAGEAQLSHKPTAPLFFLGNTGSGKSTLINYLVGCEMEKREGADFGALEDVVVVKETSSIKECAKIGHYPESETLIPALIQHKNQAYYDCPGFLDSRGPEIQVANMVNILNAFHASQQVRLIVLVNFHSLEADKGGGLKKTVNICQQFFADQRRITQNQGSLLFGITKIPKRRAGKQPVSLEELKKTLRSYDKGLNHQERQVIEHFADQLFIYDPQDEVDQLYYSGGLNRQQLLDKIAALPRISAPQEVFQTTLQAEQEKFIREIYETIKELINQHLCSQDLPEVHALLLLAQKLQKIDHPLIHALVKRCQEGILGFYGQIRQQLIALMASAPGDLAACQKKFEIISNGIEAFKDLPSLDLQVKLRFSSIQKDYLAYRKKVEGLLAMDQIKAQKSKLIHLICTTTQLMTRIEKEKNQAIPLDQKIQVQSVLFARLLKGLQDTFQLIIHTHNKCLHVQHRYRHPEVSQAIEGIKQEILALFEEGVAKPIQWIDLCLKRERELKMKAEELTTKRAQLEQQKEAHERLLKELQAKEESLRRQLK